MNQMSRLIRKLTVPPVFAAILLILIYLTYPAYLGTVWQLITGIVFLCILPLLAYPLQKYIPRFKDRGREGQRSLAMLFSAAGYLLGTLFALVTKIPLELKFIYFEYLLCGVTMLLFNKVFKRKASGHACGVVGPILLLFYFRLIIPAVIGVLLVIPVYVSSLRTKQHTLPQLIGGSLIPLFVLIFLHLVFHCF